MPNMYSCSWESAHPGCMIILLDQSGSMSATFGRTKAGAGMQKCDAVATVLNAFLNELITINTRVLSNGTLVVRPCADIAILGYEGSTVTSALGVALAGRDFVSLPELQMNPTYIKMRLRKEIDDTGAVIEVNVPFPIWVHPKAGGGTALLSAFQQAQSLALHWAVNHPDNYPPVVINITDGMAAGDLIRAAQDIMQIQTNDGQALVFNVHITEAPLSEVIFPSTEGELPNDQYARQLFAMSSMIPKTSRLLLESQLGHPVLPDALGMIFNGDAASVRMMCNFAIAPCTGYVDYLL